MAHKYALNLLVEAENDLWSMSLCYGHLDYSYPVVALGWFLMTLYPVADRIFISFASLRKVFGPFTVIPYKNALIFFLSDHM
jgi:hypothetical protein